MNHVRHCLTIFHVQGEAEPVLPIDTNVDELFIHFLHPSRFSTYHLIAVTALFTNPDLVFPRTFSLSNFSSTRTSHVLSPDTIYILVIMVYIVVDFQ